MKPVFRLRSALCHVRPVMLTAALAVCFCALATGCSKEVTRRKPLVVVKDTLPPKRMLDTTFDAKGITPEGDIRDTLIITKHKVQATEYHALLPYVFFAKDSANIPARYVRIDKKQRKKYNIARIPRGNTIEAYYHILNVVGQRMKERPSAVVTLLGCRSQFETGDSTLTRRRAEAIKLYLTDVWRVNPRRITVVAGDLPPNPSNSEVDVKLGAEENQRVEIGTEDEKLLAPISIPDTATLRPVGLVRFFPPQTDDSVNIPDQWSLSISIGDSVLRDAVTGSGSPPTKIDFALDDLPSMQGRSSMPVSSTISLRDTNDLEVGKAPSRKVFIREIGVYEEQYPMVGNSYVHKFNLFLFGFDSASSFSFSRQAVEPITNRITPSSTVRIVGHTDKIGLPYYNRRLSQQRADFAQELLGLKGKQVSGAGEEERIYDQSLPEGRYYSRTVTVTVTTPVEAEARRNAEMQKQLKSDLEKQKATPIPKKKPKAEQQPGQ